MDTNKYKSRSIHVEHINDATRLGMTMSKYIDHLKKTTKELALQEKTLEQKEQSTKLQSLEGTVSSLAEALKHQRFLTDVQSKKIDDQTNMIAQLIEMQNKLMNAYSADVEFIQALKQEITQ